MPRKIKAVPVETESIVAKPDPVLALDDVQVEEEPIQEPVKEEPIKEEPRQRLDSEEIIKIMSEVDNMKKKKKDEERIECPDCHGMFLKKTLKYSHAKVCKARAQPPPSPVAPVEEVKPTVQEKPKPVSIKETKRQRYEALLGM